MILFFQKTHKWLALGLTLFLLLFAASGIVMNHRKCFSGIDVNRKLLPRENFYVHWNNAAVRGSLALAPDSILVYGNIGVWLTDSTFRDFKDFNAGFPKGIDNRKISALCQLPSGTLFAGTLFGLYQYNEANKAWKACEQPGHEPRVADVSSRGDSLLVLTRSELVIRLPQERVEVQDLPPPQGYANQVGLFKTLWLIHSGEIYGLAGKVIVDAIGLIFIFLTITGLIFFVNRYRIRERKKKGRKVKKLALSSKWNLKWHNKVGWTTLVLILLTTFTGMFLRPPLLIAIATKQVPKIPGTQLDSPNAWYDKLRAIRYEEQSQSFLVATSEGIYRADAALEKELQYIPHQPPLSVMGINVFESMAPGVWMVGSFSGLFVWIPEEGVVMDRFSGEPWKTPERPGPPISANMITGMSLDYQGMAVYFDYNLGARMGEPGRPFPPMPEELVNTPISLWNTALEVHTGRIYKPLLGRMYILVVPLVGLLTLFMSIAGFVVWFKRRR